MRRAKKVVSIFMVMVMLLCTLGVSSVETNAATLTKKQVKEKIEKTKAQIKKLKKQKKAEEAKYKKQTAGTTSVVGTIQSYNPYILYDSWTGSYYWVENPKNLTVLITYASGHLKLTGEYRTWNNKTCAVAKAAKVTANTTAIKKKIEAKEAQLEKYRQAMEDKVILEDWGFVTGSKGELEYSWKYNGDYNKITWKSSDSSIASIDKKGVVTAKKPGVVTISAKASASGKTTKCKVYVEDLQLSLNESQLTLAKDEYVSMYYIVQPEWVNFEFVQWGTTNPSVASVKQNSSGTEAVVYAVGEGSCDIVAIFEESYELVCHVTVTSAGNDMNIENPNENSNENFSENINENFDEDFDETPVDDWDEDMNQYSSTNRFTKDYMEIYRAIKSLKLVHCKGN